MEAEVPGWQVWMVVWKATDWEEARATPDLTTRVLTQSSPGHACLYLPDQRDYLRS